MYYRDHNPPHFHARYGEYAAEIGLSGKIIYGHLPPRIAGFAIEWLLLHRKEVEDNWLNMRNMSNPKKIRPLE